MISKDVPRHKTAIAYLKTSKALYLFKYFMFRLYARKNSAGFFTEKDFFPISLMTSGASWNIGSKTRRFLDPSSFFSMPTMVIEWPLMVSKDQSECCPHTWMLKVNRRQLCPPDLGGAINTTSTKVFFNVSHQYLICS
jgi:hypothetical protein